MSFFIFIRFPVLSKTPNNVREFRYYQQWWKKSRKTHYLKIAKEFDFGSPIVDSIFNVALVLSSSNVIPKICEIIESFVWWVSFEIHLKIANVRDSIWSLLFGRINPPGHSFSSLANDHVCEHATKSKWPDEREEQKCKFDLFFCNNEFNHSKIIVILMFDILLD